MTKQEAAKILRTEQIGDSEQMELAKQMGAKALESLPAVFILPKCGHCGLHISGISILNFFSTHPYDINVASRIDPERCPKCGTFFTRIDIDWENEICIARGEDDATS